MAAIGGKKREQQEDFDKRKFVGLFEAKIIAINPTIEQFKEKLDIELKEDSKQADYLGESKIGNTILRVDVWLEDNKTSNDEKPRRFKRSFFLEDKEKENKDGSKQQYINNIGICTWASDVNEFPKWFKERDYRQAYVGEEKLYAFMRTWLGNLNCRDAETTLSLDWKKLMKGNVKDLKDQIGGEYATTVLALATVRTVEKTNAEGETEIKEYQSVYEEFLPSYTLKSFRVMDYDNTRTIKLLAEKSSKDLKLQERFVINIHGEYGSKEFFKLKDIHEYSADSNLVSSDAALAEEDDDY